MKITYKGDYALKTILELALNYGNGVITIHQLAKLADIPFKFLEQVLLDLKRGGFVKSRRGKIGGYQLAVEPAKIKLGNVIRFIDGPIEPIGCVNSDYTGCRDLKRCVFRSVWKDVNRVTSAIVDNINFGDLISTINARDKAIVYQI